MKNILVVFVAVIMAGCGSIKVKHPEVDQLRKVAIVSVVGNRIFEKENAGRNNESGFGRLAGIVSATKKEPVSKDPKADDARAQLLGSAAEIFKAALSTIPNWSVTTPQSMYESKEYKKVVDMYASGPFMDVMFITPRKMGYISFYRGFNDEKKAALMELCKANHLDALAAIDVHFQYDPKTFSSIGGNGLANAKVGAGTFILNCNGDLLVDFPSAMNGEKFQADDTVSILFDDVYLNDVSMKAYEGALKKAADFNAQQIMGQQKK